MATRNSQFPASALQASTSFASLAMKSAEMALASAQTIFYRTWMMMAAGSEPTAKDWREYMRMSAEKLAAAASSSRAWTTSGPGVGRRASALADAQHQVLDAALDLGRARSLPDLLAAQNRYATALAASGDAALGFWRSYVEAMSGGMRPYHTRATANARRLGNARNRR